MKKNYFLILFALLANIFLATAQTYQSQNMYLLSNWFDASVVAEPTYGIKYNGVWGWVDPVGNEYAIMGSKAGTYFVNVTNPSAPVQCDFVAGRRSGCIWREVKTYQNYCYIVGDDSPPNSFQIVDMSYLPDSVHVVYDSDTLFATSHTIWVDGTKLYGAYVRGTSAAFNQSAGLAVFDISNPSLPVLLRRIEDDFPTFTSAHDMYVRNDTIYASSGFDGLYVFRLNSLNQFEMLGTLTNYFNQGYNHSSALSNDGQTLIFCEEIPAGQAVRSLDVSDISNMQIVSNFQSHVGATAHNPFIKDNYCFIAYYQDGLQVFDISNPTNPTLIGYFDTHWQNDAIGNYPPPVYEGAWGAYPWLPSGNLIVSDMQNGLYVLDASAITSVKHTIVSESFLMYPNPTNKDLIYIKVPASFNKIVSYELFNAQAQLIQKNNLSDNVINIENLPSGIYTLRLLGDNTISTQKFVRVKL